MSSKVASPFCIPSSNERELLLLHSLASTDVSVFWTLAIPMVVQWNLIIVLICISLMTWRGAAFHMLTYLLHLFFGEMSAQVFDPFFNQVVCFPLLNFKWLLFISLLAIFESHLRDLKITFLAICILNIQSTKHIPLSSLSDMYEELRVLVCLKRIEVVYFFNFWPIDALQSNKRSSLANGDLEKICVFMSEFSLSFTERLIISRFTTAACSV